MLSARAAAVESSTTINRGKGLLLGQAARRDGASSAETTAALTPLAARIAAARNGRPGGIDRHVRCARAQNAVNRGDGLETLGKPEADAIAAVDAPARRAGWQARRRARSSSA